MQVRKKYPVDSPSKIGLHLQLRANRTNTTAKFAEYSNASYSLYEQRAELPKCKSWRSTEKNAANLSLKDIDRTTPLHSLGNGKIKIVRDTVRECS